MTSTSTPAYRFGDVLALARQSWVSRVAAELTEAGYPGYRRSDSAVVRLLRRGPIPVGRLGEALGVTRQAARKAAAGLEERGLGTVTRDQRDGRQFNVELTQAGHEYARTIVRVLDRLEHALTSQLTEEQLATADTVLRAVFADERTPARAALLAPPPANSSATGQDS